MDETLNEVQPEAVQEVEPMEEAQPTQEVETIDPSKVDDAKGTITEDGDNVATIIEKWFSTHFQNVVGLETPIYNRILHAKEELKQLLGDIK